ncbi:MAG: hypothetical protein E3J88_03525 [Anaerolineales bacterium]|nr:MAG: hypothetical protein E3J88_03525 [Anaerolineales bacterium]
MDKEILKKYAGYAGRFAGYAGLGLVGGYLATGLMIGDFQKPFHSYFRINDDLIYLVLLVFQILGGIFGGRFTYIWWGAFGGGLFLSLVYLTAFKYLIN